MKLVQDKLDVMGDAGGDPDAALRSATALVHREAAGYTLPNAARNRSEAIQALMLLMRRAASENSKNAAYYNSVAEQAPLKYARVSEHPSIVYTAVNLTSNLPLTGALAKKTYEATLSARTGSKPARRRSSGAARATSTAPAPEPTVESVPAPSAGIATGLLDRVPSWAPWAAGGTLLAVATILVIRRSQS